MRLGSLSVRREDELDQQPVFLDQTQAVAVLTDDISMRAQFPGCICLPHEVATVAEVLALLDIVVESERKNDAQRRDDEQKGNEYPLFLRAQSLLKLVNYFVNKFEHQFPDRAATVSDARQSGPRSAPLLF